MDLIIAIMIIMILILPIILLIVSKYKLKNNNKITNTIEQDLGKMNHEVTNTLRNYTSNIDEIEVIVQNITIYSAFYCYYHRDEISQNCIFQYIQTFLNFLDTTSISKNTIDDVKYQIINNKVFIEEELIPNKTIEEIIDYLVMKIVNNCSDLEYSKLSKLAIKLALILTYYTSNIIYSEK